MWGLIITRDWRNLGYHSYACWLERRCIGNSVRACIEGTVGIDHINEFTEKYRYIDLRAYF